MGRRIREVFSTLDACWWLLAPSDCEGVDGLEADDVVNWVKPTSTVPNSFQSLWRFQPLTSRGRGWIRPVPWIRRRRSPASRHRDTWRSWPGGRSGANKLECRPASLLLPTGHAPVSPRRTWRWEWAWWSWPWRAARRSTAGARRGRASSQSGRLSTGCTSEPRGSFTEPRQTC